MEEVALLHVLYTLLSVLTITSAFPCRGLEGEEGVQGGGDDKDNNSCSGHHHHQDSSNTATSRHTNVEMDPTSEVEVRAKIRNIGKNVVGWYHSHPTFDALPSLIDLENQRNYQMLFQEDQDGEDGGNGGEVGGTGGRMVGGDEPFVGIIVGRFCLLLGTKISALLLFSHTRSFSLFKLLMILNRQLHNPASIGSTWVMRLVMRLAAKAMVMAGIRFLLIITMLNNYPTLSSTTR